MTAVEFFGCVFLAFGPPFSMFILTIAHDPVRIIILIVAAFFWLLSLLVSSVWWFVVSPFTSQLVFGLVFSVFFQEIFRGIIYTILRRAQVGLTKITDDTTTLIENKHILSYVSGLGFGIMSGAFQLVNVLADLIGPGTMGIKDGTETFFLTSSAITVCIVLLHTFWSVIFFDAMDRKNKFQLAAVVFSHLLVSCLTLLDKYKIYYATIVPIYLVCILMGLLAFRVAGGSYRTFKNCVAPR